MGQGPAVPADRIAAMLAAGYWKNETVDQYLDRWATRRPDKPAIVDAASRYTWQQLARAVDRVAHGLDPAEADCPDGGRVLSLEPPAAYWPEPYPGWALPNNGTSFRGGPLEV